MPSSEPRQDPIEDVLAAFVEERDWAQFHTPGHLAASIAIESGELLECFQWGAVPPDDRVADELADVLTYAYLLAARLGRKPEELIRHKLEITRAKYPVARARGRSEKHGRLPD